MLGRQQYTPQFVFINHTKQRNSLKKTTKRTPKGSKKDDMVQIRQLSCFGEKKKEDA